MKNSIRNQKGIALVTTLMLLVLGFAVVAILFRLATQETKLARLEQGYTTALDAAKAGTDLFIYMIENQAHNPPVPTGSGASTPFGTSSLSGQCLQVKMANPTSSWYTSAWNTAGCPSQASGLATSTDPTVGTDITLTLGTSPTNYTVKIKVIDNWTTQATGSAPCTNGCFYYTVVARAQAAGSAEHSDVQFVYRYSQ